MKPEIQQKIKNSWKLVFAVFISVALLSWYFFYHKNSAPGAIFSQMSNPKNSHGGVVEYNQKPKIDGPVFKSMKLRNWNELKKNLSIDKTNWEVELGQLIYFLDLKGLETEDSLQFVKSLLEVVDQKKKLSPREIQLLSRIIGKLELNSSGKDVVEKFYIKKKLLKHPSWKEVTIRWVPLPSSTKNDLISLLKKDRPDMTADFVYFVSKVSDAEAKKSLIKAAKKNLRDLNSSQVTFIETNLVIQGSDE